jgi:hypothetical protein
MEALEDTLQEANGFISPILKKGIQWKAIGLQHQELTG